MGQVGLGFGLVMFAVTEAETFYFHFLMCWDRNDIEHPRPPRAEGVDPERGRGEGQPTPPPWCTLGSEHTIVIGRVARLGISDSKSLKTLKGTPSQVGYSFKPSSHNDDDDHRGTTNRVLFAGIHAQDTAQQVSFYSAKKDNTTET